MTTQIETRFFKLTTLLLLCVMTVVGFTPRVEAGFVPNTTLSGQLDRGQDLDAVRQTLENKMVTKRLQELGYSQEEIKDRLAQLSDEDLHRLTTSIQDVDVAGDGIGFIIGVLIIVALVVLILNLADKRVTIS
ncbi:PA2779 family protein [Salidesulfovibrio onnuriiensis]|uniref:PA2779 family protein n=1 Tax=Salidesulfovibrio onnuriiensis TaxID=2583823 RepID=UPI0011C90C99|nr:PA2779 family protein [Salidesulfovibrio onnuriiensis]